MKIGIPKESFPLEKRVMLMPNAVGGIVKAGHEIFVQSQAAAGIRIQDSEYHAAGAQIVSAPETLYELAELVVKLKAPSPEEFSLMHDLILFSMFHSEQNKSHVYYAGRQNLTVIEMESIRDTRKKRVIDQTDITGKVGVYYALQHSQKMPEDMNAVILGYGNVSSGAVDACAKLGIKFKIVRKRELGYLSEFLKDADLLINGITWPESRRAAKEYLVTREDIKNTPKGIIILDLSADFPNPIETIHPTSYAQPYYLEEERVHISIYGYPGLVPLTSSCNYSKQVEPLVLLIANNNGLDGIENKGDIGKYIKKAIIDPKKSDWEKHCPPEVGSRSMLE